MKFERGTVRANNADVYIDLDEGAIIPADLTARLFAPVVPHPVSFYLRGEEYSLQLEVFLESISGRKIVVGDDLPSDTAATLQDGLEVDKLINIIVTKVGLA
ncbi:hypothetical protein LP414_33195 [Polaromonas sp. P1(28)-13]|nr:hypothetical protein LP414_33195 [Polaromonas sp. P1(28)-13]